MIPKDIELLTADLIQVAWQRNQAQLFQNFTAAIHSVLMDLGMSCDEEMAKPENRKSDWGTK